MKKQVIHKLAAKYGLPVNVIEAVVNAQFKGLRKHIESEHGLPIRLRYFGLFKPAPSRVCNDCNKLNLYCVCPGNKFHHSNFTRVKPPFDTL